MKYGNNNCSLNTVSIGLCHTTNYSNDIFNFTDLFNTSTVVEF